MRKQKAALVQKGNNVTLVILRDIFVVRQGFFSLRLKNSRAQKLKLKNFLPKTQGFFVQKLKKSEILGAILVEKSKFPRKIGVFEKISWKLKNFSKTQAQNLPKTQGFGKFILLRCRKNG